MSAPTIPFRREMTVRYRVAEELSPRVRRVIAENPSSFTFRGTNTYIVGRGRVAVIDPGPRIEAHLDALVAALAREVVTHIFVTHTHLDHSEATHALRDRVGGKLVGAHPRPIDEAEKPSESIDRRFAPDIVLTDGAVFAEGGWTLRSVFTPGHMSNHHCFALEEENVLFSGDHVMGWNTSIVSPPDGNMREYMASLDRCLARGDRLYWPGHGPEIPEPRPFVRAYLGHRRMRETEITRCMERGQRTIPEMVATMYRHLPIEMHGAAGRAVFAHLEHMVETGRAACDGPVTAASSYRLP